VLASIKNVEFGNLILDGIAAHKLNQLILTGPEFGDGGWDHWDHIRSFLVHSRPPLQVLRLMGVPITTEQLVGCLASVPTVRNLTLDGCVFDDYVVSKLTWIPVPVVATRKLAEINLLPCLLKLTVSGCSTRYLSVQAFVLMVYSRLRYWDAGGKANWQRDCSPLVRLSYIFLSTGFPWRDVSQDRMFNGFTSDPFLLQYRKERYFVLCRDSGIVECT